MSKSKVLFFLKLFILFVLFPAAIFIGIFVFKEKGYPYVITAVTVFTLVIFFASFEKKKITSRRLVLCSVMTCLAVVGRFIPFLKPVAAVTTVSGMYLGSFSGFLVGALSALVSNFYFGQGPWTPHQMFAWGLIGFFSGVFSKVIEKSRLALVLFAVISAIGYSMLLDVWTVLWYNGTFSLSLYTAALVTSLPHTLLYTVSNVIFLVLLHPSLGARLKRIKIKYGV